MNLTSKNFITLENKVRHLLKSTSMIYKHYEYHPEEVRVYHDNGETWEELFNAEIYIYVEDCDKNFRKIEETLCDWAWKKFDGLIVYLNAI